MKWFSGQSLDALVECLNGSRLKLAQAVQEAVKEIYDGMETLEQRLEILEQNAMAVRHIAEDGKLEFTTAASVRTARMEGKGEERSDGT